MKPTDKFIAGAAGLVICVAVFFFDVATGGSPAGFAIALCSAIFSFVMGILLFLDKQKKGLVLSAISGAIAIFMVLLFSGMV